MAIKCLYDCAVSRGRAAAFHFAILSIALLKRGKNEKNSTGTVFGTSDRWGPLRDICYGTGLVQ